MAKVLHGDAGGNQLNASADKTQVYGLKGNDTLISDGKSDVLLVGGGGDDSLIVLGGEATLSGGDGSDTLELNYSADKKLSAVIEDLEPTKDKIVVKFDGATAPQLSSVASGNDVVWKDADGNFNVTLKSVRENDYYDGAASTDDWDAWEAWKVLERTNQVREDAGLAPLTLSQGLMSGASIRAQEITSQGQDGALTNHTRPNGTNFSTVLNNKYSNPSENLDGGARTPAEVLEDWMNSTAHSENILSSSFQKMGLGYVYNDSDVTNHRWYWAQMFADNLRSPETVSAASLLSADIEINSGSNFIQLTEGNDTRANNLYGATIDALSGNDSITNSGLNVSISGGADDDTILSGGSFATIAGNAGNDLISLSTDSKENVIEYSSGDGNDSVSGMNSTDTLKILDDEYTPATVGNNIVVAVGSDSITLTGATDLDSVNIEGTRSNRYVYTDANERISNSLEGATIDALGGRDIIGNVSLGTGAILDGGAGDDTINNNAANVSINGGEGDDSIDNDAVYVSIDIGSGDGIDEGSNVTINGGAGSDSISNHSVLVSIFGGGGNDDIDNSGSFVTIDGGAGDDYIYNEAGEGDVKVAGGAGNDSINNSGDNVTIDGGDGDDSIENRGDYVSIDGGAGNDDIDNWGDYVSILGGTGNDSIRNSGEEVTINAGKGDDSIYNDENNVTINAGKGDDSIILNSSFYDSAQYNLIVYNVGDGNDTIWDFDGDDTLSISGGNYVRSTVVSDIIFVVGEGEIRLVDAAQLGDFLNVIGTGTEGDEYKGYVEITENNAIYHNDLNHATIVATGENVSISNSGNNVSIVGGEGNDSIYNDGNNVSISNSGNNVSIVGGEGNDSIYNDGNNVTIDAGAGNDLIYNDGENASIVGGEGADTISSIKAGAGDDQINLASDSENNLIVYNVGDGNDLICGFNDDDTLEINDVTGNYSTQTNGNDIIVNVEDDSITLQGAASLEAANIFINWSGSQGNSVILTESNDIYENGADNVTIQALGGNDTIRNYVFDSLGNLNWGNFVSIDGGEGDDDIFFDGNNNSINAGAGNDSINNSGYYVPIDGGEGDDWIYNAYGANSVSIDGGDGDDDISNHGSNVSILGGTGNDSIYNDENNVTIDAGAGDDWIYNAYGANSVSINGGAGDDWIYNAYGANSVSIDGGDGDDSISNSGDSVTIDSGAGNDSIDNYNSDSVTINTGAGDDLITNWNSYNVSIVSGDGNDSIVNGEDDVSNEEPIINAENIDIDNSSYNALIDSGAGNDYIVNNSNNVTIIAGTGDDRISLESVTGNLIQYTEGDGNDTIWGFDENSSLQIGDGTATYSRQGVGDDIVIRVGEGSITLKDARDKPDHIILGESASSGGTSSGDGGSSSSGDGGSSSSGDGGSSSSGDGGSSSSGDGGSSNNSGGSSVAGTSTDSSSDNGNGTSGTSSGQNDSRGRSSRSRINTTTTSSTPSTPATSTAFNVSAQLNADTSQQNTEERPKITLNAPTYANNPSGDEVVALIQSGDESFRKLWGSEGNDTLYGGEGVDIFIGSKNEGTLTFRNVSAEDIVYLSDVSLNDLSDIKKENDMVTFSLKTGNTFTIQSSDTVSGAIVLSDLTVHLTHPPKP